MKYCSLKTNINAISILTLVVLTRNANGRIGKQANIDTVKLYPALNFEVIKSSSLWIWDKNMEYRYWEQLMNWRVKPLKVVIVPFSHNDAGWLQTFEEYYETKTKRILDNIVKVLPEMQDMTFVWSEICFLQHWWDRSTEQSRDTLKHLINVGKLEIITGGWVMADEATTHIFSLHNQLVEGHQWIWENLGIYPEYSWSIDPFGCSSAMAYLLASSEIKGLVVQRIHYSWKRFFSDEALLDVLWEQDFEAPNIKLRIQQNWGYTVTDSCGPAKSLCQQYDFNKEISDADHITFGNIRQKAEVLLGLYGRIGSLSESNAVLITLGGDFRFENETEWFQQYRNYKALMDYINNFKDYKAHIYFGTLKHFFNQVENPNVTLQGDFFPYADLNPDNSLAYWTGYYSTRPYWKKLARNLESMLRSTEILYTLTFNAIALPIQNSEQFAVLLTHFKKLTRARRATALFQHHDGITGTAKARVMNDYKIKILRSMHELKVIQNSCIEIMLLKYANSSSVNDKLSKKIVVFNSLAQSRPDAIIIKIDYPSVIVTDSAHNQIQSQVKCLFSNNLTLSTLEMWDGRYELTFVPILAPFSINTYDIRSIDFDYKQNNYVNWDERNNTVDGLYVINKVQKIIFAKNGLVKMITKSFGAISLTSNLKAYTSELGNSGAYLFKPLREEIDILSETLEGDIVFVDGPIYKEVRVWYGEEYLISTRLYGSNTNLNEVIEMKITYNISETNRELFMEFITDLKETKFYTDVNSFEMRERIRNTSQFTEGNYYPITSLAFIENNDFIFAIITDHSHGAASLENGSIEIMLDRRISTDDRRGLEESLEDKIRTTSTFYLVFLKAQPYSKEFLYKLAIQLNNPSSIIMTPNEMPSISLNLVNKPLPSHINMLNFRTISRYGVPSSTALMTLHNLGSHDSDTFLKDTQFDNVEIKSIFRTSLTGLKDEYELDELHDIKVKAFNIMSIKVFFHFKNNADETTILKQLYKSE